MNLTTMQWAYSKNKATRTSHHILGVMANNCGEANRCRLSLRQIRSITGYHLDLIRKSITDLESLNLIVTTKTPGQPTVYTLQATNLWLVTNPRILKKAR